ncbi:hypothetical protein EDD16DRAFT_1535532 [Pisolithus croceorrhizus]|nr:hypothetical protein EDD16DRAFT_1535532 [Pisolithus croceorrhizus]
MACAPFLYFLTPQSVTGLQSDNVSTAMRWTSASAAAALQRRMLPPPRTCTMVTALSRTPMMWTDAEIKVMMALSTLIAPFESVIDNTCSVRGFLLDLNSSMDICGANTEKQARVLLVVFLIKSELTDKSLDLAW